jgi:hypothetical protein
MVLGQNLNRKSKNRALSRNHRLALHTLELDSEIIDEIADLNLLLLFSFFLEKSLSFCPDFDVI